MPLVFKAADVQFR